MKHTIENNRRLWDAEYPWTRDGDEWDGQARRCNQPYDAWKQSLLETFVVPYVAPQCTILEIGAGHGRWSRQLVDLCEKLILVDLSPNCLQHCRSLLGDDPRVVYLQSDGRSLVGVADHSIDLVWSFDVFVHLSAAVVRSYFAEINRVLRDRGRAIIHHPGRRHLFLWLSFLKSRGWLGSTTYKYLSMGQLGGYDGWRSDISRRLIRKLAADTGLETLDQLSSWGESGQYGVPLYGDAISILARPGARSRAQT